jgi:hypothetical protein
MNRMAAALGLVVAAAGFTVGVNAHEGQHKEAASNEAKAVTVQGELIDTACYVSSDGDAKGKDHAECAGKCLGSGVPAAILPDGSKDAMAIRYLLTNPTVLAPYAAQTIKVEGTENAGMHAIDVKKLSVKDDKGGWKEVQLKDEHHKMGEGAEAPHTEAPKADSGKKDGHADHKH